MVEIIEKLNRDYRKIECVDLRWGEKEAEEKEMVETATGH